MDQDHSSAASGVCPACGTPRPAGIEGAGCPVCLLRGALASGAEVEGGPLGEAPPPSDAGRFDHYALVRRPEGTFEELGRGAMGITYRAVDTVLGHAVALKVLDRRVAAHPQARERFLREAQAAARLRHPNVASVFYYGMRKGDGQCFYAMELVEGESLEVRLRRAGPLRVTLALEIVAQVARALGAAEAQGLVHRDLKPANLMLVHGPALTVKVIDFGLAKAAEEVASEADLTQGGFVGTPAFASPEQCAAASVDARADLYSLGITLWQMLTGQTPFRGSPAEVMRQHQSAPLPLEQLKDVPQPLVVLLEALLEKDPARRPQSPTDLQALLRSLSVDLQAEGQSDKGNLAGPDAKGQGSRWLRRKGRIAVVSLLLVATAAALYWLFPKPVLPSANTKSVAVLPFDNIGDSKENVYFSDGLTSEVIFQLSKVADLRVISRQSVLRYRDVPIEHQKSLGEIGRELNVATILESSVERIDNRVKIITVLYDADMNKRRWGASYDREIKDIFAIQTDVAEQIAAALKATLSADERSRIQRKPTESFAAYDLYLRGWGLYELYRNDDNEKAIGLFKQAIEADPKFALAYTGLADAYIERVQRFHGEDFWSDSAIDLCQQAVALGPNETRGYTELARAFLNKGWNERAHEPIHRALELDPNDWRANRFAADELSRTRQYDQMYMYLRKCFAVNPNDPYAPNLMGYICWMVGENGLAEKWMKRAIDLETDSQRHLLMECERSVLRGDYAAAVPGLEQLPDGFYGYAFSASGLLIDCLTHLKDWPGLLHLMVRLKSSGDSRKGGDPATLLIPEAIALRALGYEAEARQTTERCETIARDHLITKKYDEHWSHWILAFCARFLGRKEEAYQHMQESFVNGDVAFLGWLPDGPSLQVFKPDPEFQAILADRDTQNAGKRIQILAIEKNFQ